MPLDKSWGTLALTNAAPGESTYAIARSRPWFHIFYVSSNAIMIFFFHRGTPPAFSIMAASTCT